MACTGVVPGNSVLEFPEKRGYQVVRRAQDIVLSVLALLVLALPFLFIGIAVYIDDPSGSPFFKQERIGKNGKIFRIIKFRSMFTDAEEKLDSLMELNEKDGPLFKMKEDPRVTRVGHFIRKTCIDELPQLWNILKGDMSIVGPRPCLPREYEKFNDDEKRVKTFLRPGLTCYLQVCQNGNNIHFKEGIEFDRKYITERSFILDWQLIFRTIGVMICGKSM